MSEKMIPNDSGSSFSPWMQERVPDLWAELAAETYAEVCVIGAGMVGLSVAYQLTHEGKDVLVIDDGPIGGGETSRTTAHLACALDDRIYWLEQHHGHHAARLAIESHAAGIDWIESIVHGEHVACDFRRVDGYLFAPPGGSVDELERELAAAHRVGLVETEMLADAPLHGRLTGPCLRFPRQAQFHPIKFLRALAEAIGVRGGRIATGVRAEHVEGGSPAQILVEGGRVIHAGAVVVATNAPISSRVKIPLKQAAYRTYVVGLELPRRSAVLGLYWDTADPYHYARIIPDGAEDGDLLIVGGEDHKTGQGNDAEARWLRLADWGRAHFAGAGALVQRWSGQVMEPADGLGFIGKNPGGDDNVYVATGDSGNGLTNAAVAGMLLTDLILGRPSPWAAIYDPSRSELRRAAGSMLRENANTTAQYADWLSGGDVGSIDDIPPGSGAVVRRGLRLIACYRDEAGMCHERTAVCTHLGGVVAWNAAEKSWDCPCHGSRFDALGRVINGPAIADLAPAEEAVGQEVPVRVVEPLPTGPTRLR